MIELTAQERERFALWLEKEAEQSDLMAKQADSMKSDRALPQDAMWEQLGRRERMWAAACMFVARRLRTIEEMTVERS